MRLTLTNPSQINLYGRQFKKKTLVRILESRYYICIFVDNDNVNKNNCSVILYRFN